MVVLSFVCSSASVAVFSRKESSVFSVLSCNGFILKTVDCTVRSGQSCPLDVVIQVALILISCTSEVYHMGDIVLHAGSVKANTTLGICVKNRAKNK